MSENNITTESPAYHLVRHVYDQVCVKQNPWRHINPVLSDAMKLAITSRLRFDIGDFSRIYRECDGYYWFGDSGVSDRFYTVAVEAESTSACLSWESWKGRKPFVLGGKRLCEYAQVNPKHLGLEPDPRVVVWRVTSFAADNSYLNVGGFDKWREGTMVRRTKLTWEQTDAFDQAERQAKRRAERERREAAPLGISNWFKVKSVTNTLTRAARRLPEAEQKRAKALIRLIRRDDRDWADWLRVETLGEFADLRPWLLGVLREAAKEENIWSVPYAVRNVLQEEPHE